MDAEVRVNSALLSAAHTALIIYHLPESLSSSFGMFLKQKNTSDFRIVVPAVQVIESCLPEGSSHIQVLCAPIIESKGRTILIVEVADRSTPVVLAEDLSSFRSILPGDRAGLLLYPRSGRVILILDGLAAGHCALQLPPLLPGESHPPVA